MALYLQRPFRSEKGAMDKNWPVADIERELESILDTFLKEVPKELLSAAWRTDAESNEVHM
jgi:hypothetical protein